MIKYKKIIVNAEEKKDEEKANLEEKIEKQETREKTEETENQKEISKELNKGNKEDEIPEDDLEETKAPENTESGFSEEAAEMNDENSPENSESKIQNEDVDEGQFSDPARFPGPGDSSGVTVPAETDPPTAETSGPEGEAPAPNLNQCEARSLRSRSTSGVTVSQQPDRTSRRGQILSTHASHESTESDPSDSPPDDDGIPEYLKILRNVYERSDLSEDGGFTFTLDEMYSLASDPDFCQIYPQAAAEFRSVLQEIEDE